MVRCKNNTNGAFRRTNLACVPDYPLFEPNSGIGHKSQGRFTEEARPDPEGKSLRFPEGSIPLAAAVGSDEPVFYHSEHPTSPSAKGSNGPAPFQLTGTVVRRGVRRAR